MHGTWRLNLGLREGEAAGGQEQEPILIRDCMHWPHIREFTSTVSKHKSLTLAVMQESYIIVPAVMAIPT